MIKNMYRFLVMAFLAVSFSGCNLIPEDVDVDYFSQDEENAEDITVDVNHIAFSPDYKHLVVSLGMLHKPTPFSLADSSHIRAEVTEAFSGFSISENRSLRLDSIKNTELDEVERLGLKLLVLVDLSLPQQKVTEQRDAISAIRTVFDRNNLYLAFMHGSMVSETMKASDYLLGKYFVHSDDGDSYLYRSILQKKKEIVQRADPWKDAQRVAILVFSDGNLYAANDEPVDPDHFDLEEELLNPQTAIPDSLSLSFIKFQSSVEQANDADDGVDNFKVLCQKYHGKYFDRFDWYNLQVSLLPPGQIDMVSHRLYLTNPKFKVYVGGMDEITFSFYDVKTDSLVAQAKKEITVGSLYDPIIVEGHTLFYVICQGCIIALGCLLLFYILLQFIIPYIKYKLFCKKYVIKYVNSNMSIGNVTVSESCYLCKGPFKPGDEVVAKCQHVMHKSCWDQNGYHCPEYGHRCEHGSHYYNTENLFDPANSSFYLKWIVMSILAAVLAWTVFTLFCDAYSTFVVERSFLFLSGIGPHTPEAAAMLQKNAMYLNNLPFFGFTTSFFLTMGLSLLTVWRRPVRKRMKDVLLRAILAAVVSALLFLLINRFCMALQLGGFMIFLEWIPWALTGNLIVFASTFGTRIRINKLLILVPILLGIVSLYSWITVFSDLFMDLRVLFLFSYLIFSIGLAICVARDAPMSERYFLKVQGPVKEMEIALYKWFHANPNEIVTIGKSVDCSLQMSWDYESEVAPMVVDIRMQHNQPLMTALDNGVVVDGKPLEVGKSVKLYHDTKFTIGLTTFVYVEKDV